MAVQYWLLKSEPSTYSIHDLKQDKTTLWDGVRNYRARNFQREMRAGDQCLFYHSAISEPSVVGVAEVVAEAVPDPTQFDKKDSHFDPKSTKENPRWSAAKVGFVKVFKRPVALPEIKEMKACQDMLLVSKAGMRLSVQSVSRGEFNAIVKAGS